MLHGTPSRANTLSVSIRSQTAVDLRVFTCVDARSMLTPQPTGGAPCGSRKLPSGRVCGAARRRRMFSDRVQAGELLGAALTERVAGPSTVLAIPRGGVIVGARVARSIGAPLDVVVARKLGAPGNPELAVGAVADGVAALDWAACRRLRVGDSELEAEIARQHAEVARRTELYRRGRPPVELRDQNAVLIDDGVATGWTCVAAARWCRRQGASRVVVAVPVGPPGLADRLAPDVDEVVCLHTPRPYVAVGQAYREFPQVSDGEVLQVLEG
jgi:putative phosphoribosyl transferase